MRAGEVQPTDKEDEGQPRSSEPHRMDTRRGPGRLYSHIFQRSSAGRREKACWICVLALALGAVGIVYLCAIRYIQKFAHVLSGSSVPSCSW